MARLKQISNVTWAVGTAVVALLAALVPLVFQLAPQWRPDPRDRVSAEISVVAVEPCVRLGDWLDRAYPGDVKMRTKILGHKGVQPGELDFPGEIVYVRMEVQGSKGRAVRLRSRLYNARDQVPVEVGEEPFLERSSKVKINAPARGSVQLLFIADLSPETDLQFVRVELYNSAGVLAMADSPVLKRGRPLRRLPSDESSAGECEADVS